MQARGGCRTRYLDEVLLEQGHVHAAGDLPGQLQRAVPAADPPGSPQAEAARRGRGASPAQRKQQKQAQAHAGTQGSGWRGLQGAAEATVRCGKQPDLALAARPGPLRYQPRLRVS